MPTSRQSSLTSVHDPTRSSGCHSRCIRERYRSPTTSLIGASQLCPSGQLWEFRADDTAGVSDYLNAVDKYVVSSTLTEPGWQNSAVLRGPLVDEVEALKAAPGRDIVTTGSIRLVHALIAANLVDEFRLFVFPVAVGRGARLFDSAREDLELLEMRPFTSGVVLLRYAPKR
ncbi:dihydrofolate reductase family protein [Saccharopolyspora shandongensis]|uniref:dihydrofolate reductase family protein n=1 Tax=Saccharopolyspora shandongensis TaxID=418495 RepID=UPI0033F10B4B